MTSSKPTFFIVGGAWHPSACYDLLVSSLRSLDYEAVTVTPPSVGPEDPKSASLQLDTQAVQTHLRRIIECGKDVVVIGHSFGGAVAAGAAFGFSKAARAKEGLQGGVIGFVAIAAILGTEGEILLPDPPGYMPWVLVNQVSVENLKH